MRVFVYEYLCACGLTNPPSLHSEGRAMLTAVLEDLAACPGVSPVTLLAPGLPFPLPNKEKHAGNGPPRLEIHPNRPQDEEALFRRLTGRADFTLVIAPEFDDLLVRRCRWVEEEAGRLLGPTAEAAALAADKWTLAHHWQQMGIPTPATWLATASPPADFPLVIKPRFGAGSQEVRLVESEAVWAVVRKEGRIVQPFVEGLPVSVALLNGPGGTLVLPAVAQTLSRDGRFRYLGGRLPLAATLDERARRLARRAVQGISGLQGYVGIDLVLGSKADGAGDRVIEINPRLTTSYVGLRRLARFNLLEALLSPGGGVRRGRPPSEFRHGRPGEVLFRPDGRVTFSPGGGCVDSAREGVRLEENDR